MKKTCLLGFLWLAFWPACHCGAITFDLTNGVSVSVYANPFDVDGDGVVSAGEGTLTFGANGAGSPAVGSALDNVVNRRDMRTWKYGARLQDNTGVTTNGFMKFVAATPFRASTVITAQYCGSGFDTNKAWALQLDGQVAQTGPGTPNTHPIQVSSFPARTITTMRINEVMSTYLHGTPTYADFSEALLLPEPLSRIPATVVGTAGDGIGGVSTVYDLVGSIGTITDASEWYTTTAAANFTLQFGKKTTLRALVLVNWENIPIAGLDLLDDQNQAIVANIAMVGTGNNGYGEFTAIRFDSPVTTSNLVFQFHNSGGTSVGMREVIAFTPVPAAGTMVRLR